jgi:hypothetical protein
MSGADDNGLFGDTDEDGGGGGQGSYEPQSYTTGSTYHSDISIPIWEDATSFEGGAYQLRVQRQNPDGSRSDLGHIAASSSEDALIATWPQAGTFYIMPVDEHGVSLRDRPYKRVIDSDHLKLRTFLAQTGGADTGGGGGGAAMAVVMQMMKQMQADSAEERRLSRERDIALESKAARIDEMKVAMLIERESQGIELQTKIMEDHARRNDHAQNQLMQFMEASRLARESESRAETTRRDDAVREERERRQEDTERRLESERSQREMMRIQLQADADRREQAAKEQTQRYHEQMERERRMAEDRRTQDREEQQRSRDRDAEFNRDRLEQMRGEKNPLQSVMDLGAMFGMNGQDMLEKVMGAGQKSALESLASTAGDVFKSVAASGGLGGLMGGQQAEFDDSDAVAVKLPDGNVIMVPREELAAIVQPPQPTQIAPQHQQQQVPDVIDGLSVFGKSESEMVQNGTTPIVEAKPATVKVPVKVAKPARKAMRMLVGELAGCEQAEWVARIVKTATTTPEVVEYLQAVTVRGALAEAGAEDSLITAVLINLDNPEFAAFTNNIPRG